MSPGQKATSGRLLDHIVGAPKNWQRHVDTKRFSSFQIDDELHLCSLLDRKVSGFLPLENSSSIGSGKAISIP